MIKLSLADVSKTFKEVNIHKATGPDGLPGECADFNLSLTQSVIPTCFKQITIVPVPKNAKVNFMNDYPPVALKSNQIQFYWSHTDGYQMLLRV